MADHALSPPSPPHPAISPEIVEPQLQSPSTISSYIPSIISSVHHGAAYTPIDDFQEQDTSYKGASPGQPQTDDENDSVHGLRIQFPDDGEERERRLSFGATVIHKPSSTSLLSPNSARSIGLGRLSRSASLDSEEQDITYRQHSEPPLYRPFTEDDDDDTRNLTRPRASTSGTSITIGQTLHPDEPLCKTKHQFFQGRANWLYTTIIFLSVYSTVFSAIWLGLAVTKPHYGRHIMDNGPLTPSTASLLCAAFAKTIELSFVTVFVSFLGQVLSHRAIVTNSKGVTIAEMTMRAWVQQPGTMITHWESVRYAGLSFLGAISLTAALMAMFYTTASDALVTPKLKFGSSKLKVLHGEVKTIFANESQQIANCKTPMNNDNDNWNYGPTCVEIEHSGQAYHNYAQFLTNWDVIIKDGNGTTDQSRRPPPVGMLYDNTSITGSWVEINNMNGVSNEFNRVVNNVTLAMPLTSVFNAAKHPVNGILQPQELDGLGEYYVHASVPSPTINVLCASLTDAELQPLIVSSWPATGIFNHSLYPLGYDVPRRPSWFNKTVVDDLFGWGERYGRRAPVFPIIPAPFNTVYNNTDEESDSLYVLAKSNDSAVGDPPDKKMNMICSLRSAMTPDCSTTFHSSFSGSALSTTCNDPSDAMAYTRSRPDATSGVTNVNWTTVANQWGITVSLGAGLTSDNASNARLLTQMMPLDRKLDPARPSIAEALAVEAGCTVILSGIDSPLIHYWNYTDQLDINGQTWKRNQTEFQAFNATVRSQEYSSGGTLRWQGVFYVILVAVFLTNAFCLAYFVLGHHGLITDFIEPQNLFALSLGSPPSKALEGACGGGPEGGQFLSSWHIELDKRRDHFFMRSLDVPGEGVVRRRRRTNRKSKDIGESEEDDGPIMDGSMMNNGRGRGSEGGYEEMRMEGSPVAEMYDRLSKRRTSSLL